MSEAATQSDSPAQTNDAGMGTTDQGQSANSNQGSANDPSAFQADYTRKYQELADQRKAFETEKTQFQFQRSSYQQPQANQGYSQGYGYQQAPAGNPAQGYSQGYSQQQVDPTRQLVDQFGVDGAQAIYSLFSQAQTEVNRTKYQLLHEAEVNKGVQTYGKESWEKHNYVDPQTGEMRNRVMDARLSINPLTGQSLTLEQAWRAANTTDETALRQKIRDEVYAEMRGKQAATPDAGRDVNPRAVATGHAGSFEEAFAQAKHELGL